MLRSLLPAVLALAGLTLVACGTKLNPGPNPGGCDQTVNVSYSTQIQPILAAYCTSCHSATSANRGGAPASINLDTYAGAAAHAERSNTRIQAGTMPPSHRGSQVSAPDQCLFQAWVDQGASEN